jgi:hypothetical protein
MIAHQQFRSWKKRLDPTPEAIIKYKELLDFESVFEI